MLRLVWDPELDLDTYDAAGPGGNIFLVRLPPDPAAALAVSPLRHWII